MDIGFFIGNASYIPNAKLLCESIRRNGGKYADAKINIFALSHKNINIEIWDATVYYIELDTELTEFPFADKLKAASEFEKIAKGENLWLDSDSFFVSEPIELSQLIPYTIGLRPVDQKNVGCLGHEKLSTPWAIIYDQLDVSHLQPTVMTTVSCEAIYPYFNIGFVYQTHHTTLFSTAYTHMKLLLTHKDIIAFVNAAYGNKIFFHQMVFSICVLKIYGWNHIQILSAAINFPLHFINEHPKHLVLSDVNTLRYDTYFENHDLPVEFRLLDDIVKEDLCLNWYY